MSTTRSTAGRIWLGIVIGSFIAVPLTIAVQLVWTWFTDHPVVLLAPWPVVAGVFIALWLWARRRDAVRDHGLEWTLLGVLIGLVLAPLVTMLIQVVGGFLLDHWLASLCVLGWIFALLFFVLWLIARVPEE